jgi:hypothetical protein
LIRYPQRWNLSGTCLTGSATEPCIVASPTALDKSFGRLLTGREAMSMELHDLCEAEGILPLVRIDDQSLEERVRSRRLQVVAAELATRQRVSDAVRAIAAEGVDLLIIKGTALAYSLYDEPWRRLRNDTDLMIRARDRDRVQQIFQALGYEAQVSIPGDLITGAQAFDLSDTYDLLHTFDLHWRLNNSWRLAALFDFETIWQERIPLPALGPDAWGCPPWISLAIACMHRGAHMQYPSYRSGGVRRMEADLTLWIYDIHLLAGTLHKEDWNRLVQHMCQHRLGDLLLDGLMRSRSIFDTSVPEQVLAQLRQAEDQVSKFSFATAFTTEWQNFAALSWWHRLRYLSQQLLPEPAYMRQRFGEGNLCWLYLKRAVLGIIKRTGSGRP